MKKQSKTILLVEDEAIIALMEKRWLINEGFDVINVSSGEIAIETVNNCSTEINLILMDIDLGKNQIDGTQAAREILKKHDIPLLFLSSHTEMEIVDKTEGITSYGYIAKNSNNALLLASVKMAFKLHAANKELKKNEEMLKEREFWLNESQKVAGTGSYIYDFQTGQWITSKVMDEIFGIDDNYKKDINGWSNLIHPEDRDVTLLHFRKMINTRSRFDIKYRVCKPDGKVVIVHGIGKLIVDDSGELVKMIGTVQDITERTCSQQELAQKNKNIQFLNQLAFKLAELPADVNVAEFLLRQLKEFTNAALVVYSDYDSSRQALIIRQVEAHQSLLKMIINIAGENVLNTVSPVNDEAYHQMLRDTVGFSESLTEMTFGAIPEFLNNSIKTLTGIEYFYGLSYVIAGQLFGTSVLAFKSGQATPSRDLLESFAHLAAVALRRKKAEEAMRQSEEKFRSIVELSSTAMHFYNLEVNDRLVFIGSNPAADRITGISHQSLIGLSIEEAFPALTDTDIPEIYKKVAKGEISHQAFETPYQDSRFSGFYDVHIFQLRYGYVAVNFFDITDRKRAEAALRESENNFKQLIDNMGEGIGIVDKNEQFLFANQAAESIFCTAPGLLAGRSLCEFVAPDNIDIITSQTLVRQTGIKSVYESRLILHTGEKKTILITATPRFDNEGIFIGTFGIFRDITERKEAELLLKKNAAELKELNSTKDKLFSILAHDLRGPLGGFMNLTETIFTNLDELTKREITEYSSAMHVTSKKVFSLLTNLLEWSKLQTGKMEEKPVRFNLFSAVESTQNLFASSASLKSINIINEVCHNGYVFADKNLVSVILRNLISNAIKFTGRGGNIIISCCTVPDFIEISVADSGIGMSGDALQKIFRIDSGFRTEGTDGEEGSGLGLVICRELIEKCGGKIRVNSVLTKGTTFTFTLPIHQNGGDVTI